MTRAQQAGALPDKSMKLTVAFGVSQPRFDRKNISMDWVIPVKRRQKWREITHNLLAA